MITILLVEDNNAIRENTGELLKMEGYRVITAIDGKDGFDKIEEFLPDLIICDILMPEIDGFALLGKLGKQPNLKKIPLIFYTSKSEKSDIKKGLAAGSKEFIVKPSEMTVLLSAIQRCLENSYGL